MIIHSLLKTTAAFTALFVCQLTAWSQTPSKAFLEVSKNKGSRQKSFILENTSISASTFSGGQYIDRNFVILSDSSIVISTDTIPLSDFSSIEGFLLGRTKSDLDQSQKNLLIGVITAAGGSVILVKGLNTPAPTFGDPFTFRGPLILGGALGLGLGLIISSISIRNSRKTQRRFEISEDWNIQVAHLE